MRSVPDRLADGMMASVPVGSAGAMKVRICLRVHSRWRLAPNIALVLWV